MISNIQSTTKLVDKEKGLYLYTKFPKPKQLSVNQTVEEIYAAYKSEDGWLYLMYDTHKPFG